MDLHYSQTPRMYLKKRSSFTTLWIYTILKLIEVHEENNFGFTTLWIYTILKQTVGT